MAASRRPNFIFILTDEQHRRSVSAYADGPSRTPSVDRLAAEGVRLDNAYCAYPVCFPSRAAMMTGRWPHVTGVRTNQIFLPPGERHLPGLFRAAGYRTALCGKNDLLAEADLPAGFDWVWRTHHFGACDFLPDWFPPGAGAAARYYQEQLKAKVFVPFGCDVIPHPPEVCDAALITESALRFVDESAAANRPFFLWLSYPGPHWPFTCPQGYEDLVPPEAVDLPAAGDLSGKPERMRALRRALRADRASEEDFRRVLSLYYGNCRYIDDQIGRMLARLAERGLEEDTVVLFTTDHGDFLGEYGLLHKMGTFHECLTHVPMVWRRPGHIPPGPADAFVEGVDIAPTALELCGLDVPAGVQGVSHAAALRGQAPWTEREVCFAEAGTEGRPLGLADLDDLPLPEGPFEASNRAWVNLPGFLNGRGKMVRRGRWKLSWYANGEGELYDLHADPHELDNRYADPACAEIVADLKARLLHWTVATEDTLPPLP